ncbi:Protein GAMETE EXPRESSED 3 [Glycine soja]
MHLDYKCNLGTAPVHGGHGKIYLVADNRILVISYGNIGTSEPEAEVFFGPGPGHVAEAEIIGLSVSTLGSTIYINVKNRGLFAYQSRGHLLWSVEPVLYQFGYRQGCRKNLTNCYFASVPLLDHCEGSIYISNTEGELYCLSVRSRYFRWIQDFSSLDKNFTITLGNNGNVLWQRSIGPLSKVDSAPVVDSNGWISIGSLDGFLYSFSPTGVLKKFSRMNAENSIIQVGPFLDCSGFAIYSSQIEMEGKISHTIGEYTVVSAIQPKAALFTMLVPATGSIYWSESYPGHVSTLFSKSDLSQFVMNEEILLAFLAASSQKLASSCSQERTKLVSVYTDSAVHSGQKRSLKIKALEASLTIEALFRSTNYSLGRDTAHSRPKPVLPVQMGKTNYSFQYAKQKNMTMSHTLSDTSSSESSSEGETSMLEDMDSSTKGKAKTPIVSLERLQ